MKLTITAGKTKVKELQTAVRDMEWEAKTNIELTNSISADGEITEHEHKYQYLTKIMDI